jgi:hypothetical protein
MATLTFDPEYGEDGSIGMTLAVDDGPMLISGASFTGAGKFADGRTFAYAGTSMELRGDFGAPEAEGWVTELVSEDHVSGTARYIARPA